MSDGPYRSLPMSRRWKKAAKSAYFQTFSMSEIAHNLQDAVERDCRAELSAAFVGRISAAIMGPSDPDLFGDLPTAALNVLHRHCSSPMEAGLIRNAIDALEDGYRGAEAINRAAEGCINDRLLAGYRQVEEHMHREASDHRARAVRSRLETAHNEIDTSAIARRLLRAPDALPRASAIIYSGLDDGVPL